jgi:hypothetical protein
METEQPGAIDIENALAAMRPPRVPDSAFHHENASLFRIVVWKRTFAVSVLASLLTEPRYCAYGIRLDWLQRLVFSKANGQRKPPSGEISMALNAGLDRAKVLSLEDPIEDLFCNLITTPRGNFRIFTGQWETAGPYTQTLLDAFQGLRDNSLKRDVLKSVYAALRLSDELAERAGVTPYSMAGGTPQGPVAVPSIETLKRLARRVRFSDADLTRLGIDKAVLTPFIIAPRHFRHVSDCEPGNSPLEFHPLLDTSSGLVVASPAGISLAVRAALVSAAKLGGTDNALLYLLLKRQQEYSEATGFWPGRTLDLSPPDKHFLRGAAWQFAVGHFVQVIQVPVTFEHFPGLAFGSVVELGEDASKAVANQVHEFWKILAQQPECRKSVTVLLTSGWGTPHSLAPPIDDHEAPKSWQFLSLSFADAAVLGACEDGAFGNIVRILQQVDRLEADGFEFLNPNGILNLFGFWRLTGGNLIPEHLWQIAPPYHLSMPTDGLLKPRIEATKKTDIRALPLPEGEFKTVQRIDWTEDDPKPIYGSVEAAVKGGMLGAVAFGKHVWWVESIPAPGENREWRYRVWRGVLEWLAAVGPHVVSAFPLAYPPATSRVDIAVPANSAFEQIDTETRKTQALSKTLTASAPDNNHTSHIRIADEWLAFLVQPENDAEIELVSTILESFADPVHPIPHTDLAKQVLSAVESRDWRWMHARRAITPIDRLTGHGLVDSFHRIPLSAASLAKCGSIWGLRARSEGLEISGEEECRSFLTLYRNHILDELIDQVRRFDRKKLVTLAAESYQAARAEQQRWRGTIRALRAINGVVAADANAFKRQNEINAVQRAAKSICEIAACEAPDSEGLNPSRPELEELYAKSLLLFGNGQLFAAIRAGLIKPTLRISPAGDLLSDRSVFEVTLRPGAEWVNTRALSEAASAYGRDAIQGQATTTMDKLPWEAGLRRALETEYGDSPEAFFDLQYALVQVAEARGEGAFAIKRSELCSLLGENRYFPAGDHSALLERLTLPRRHSWRDLLSGLTESDFDLSRFDRRFSLINRPLLALDDSGDPLILVAPMFVADATMYSLSGLMDGRLNNQFWMSDVAKKYAGLRGKAAGEAFEESVAERLRGMKLEAWVRCKLSWALNQKVDDKLGDVDVLAVSPDRKRVWVIEAKDLRLCRTEAEVAARLYEYRGRMTRNSKGHQEPDKMLRHVRRVQYLRKHRAALCHRLKLNEPPIVKGLLIVDAPQPMNFHMLEKREDCDSAILDAIGNFEF